MVADDGISASVAFSAAEAASAATAAVLGSTPVSVHVEKLTATDSGVCTQIAAVHRLNERFAACRTYEAATQLAGELSDAALCQALINLLVDADALVELVVQLMGNLCLHDKGVHGLQRAGAFPVVVAALRADEPLVRITGLNLLVVLAERREMIVPLIKAGVIKLLCFLGKGMEACHWQQVLEIAESLLAVPFAVPERQRQQLRDVLGAAAKAHKASKEQGKGGLPLDPRRLSRLLIVLRALNMAVPSEKPKRR